MGIVMRDTQTGEITFLQKGADGVMAKIVQRNDWLEEETANMAREGLRTLVLIKIGLECPTKSYAFLPGSLSNWNYSWQCIREIWNTNTVEKKSCMSTLWRGQLCFQTIQKFVPTFGTLLVGLMGSVHSPTAKFAVDVDGNNTLVGHFSGLPLYYVLRACNLLETYSNFIFCNP